MSLYLDTSVIVPLFLPDPFVARARAFLSTGPSGLIVSDFASAEFASVVGIRLRMKLSTEAESRSAFANFDDWVRRKTTVIEIGRSNLIDATAMLRRLDLTLRTLDAIHLAAAQARNAELATFDAGMARSARALGISIIAL
ncbi:MAG: type II toxin-antitoxin system VapC family toxin [Rhizomicrobium sp.]